MQIHLSVCAKRSQLCISVIMNMMQLQYNVNEIHFYLTVIH